MKYYLYCHRRKDDNSIFYIGKGSGKRAWTRQGRNIYWKRVAEKAGFEVEILYHDLQEEEAFILEKDFIRNLKEFGCKLSNITDGGEGASGVKMSEETKLKLSKARTGIKLPLSAKEKLSKARTGIPLSQSHNLSISTSTKNRTLSPETRQKISESLLKNKNKKQGRKTKDHSSYVFYHATGCIFVGTRKEFSEATDISRNQICKLFGEAPRKAVHGWSLQPFDI